MKKEIRKAAVLGSGVMGAAIAAHLANCGIPSVMLDIVLPLSDEDKAKGVDEKSPAHRNKLAAGALQAALKAKPAPFMSSKFASLVEIGNFSDDMARCKDVDWIIEVVKEDMNIKKKVFQSLIPHYTPGTIVTTNTSGLSVNEMASIMPDEMKKNFVVTHFFNPPRYMKLLELVPCKETDPEVLAFMAKFGEEVLGKGIVFGKDTTNFVANRIGVHGIMATMKYMQELGLGFDAVDIITGSPMGHPKSATYRTADMVGLDTLAHVAQNVYDLCPNDTERDLFLPPEFIKTMISKNQLGDKTKGGFYKKTKDESGKSIVKVLDWKTGEYRDSERPEFESVKEVKGYGDPRVKVKEIIGYFDAGAKLAWKIMRDSMIYSCNRIPEIADDIVNIDNAMKWGFAWKLGPFELWDSIGVKNVIKKIEKDGLAVPDLAKAVVEKGSGSFYKSEDGVLKYFCAKDLVYKPVPIHPKIVDIQILKDVKTNVVASNDGASLIDMGDGVLCIEFTSKMNAIDDKIIEMMNKSVEIVKDKGFLGVVVGNQGSNFSVGANVMMLLEVSAQKQWDKVELVTRSFQDANMVLKYAPFPVVTAPFGMTLGGGCEVAMHGDMICAAAETYIGLVELGVGVIPAGGGCKEYVLRNMEGMLDNPNAPLLQFIQKAFENIAMAKVATSAYEAVDLNILRRTDKISTNKDFLLDDAKQLVIGLAKSGYVPKHPRTDIRLPGRWGFAAFEHAVWTMKENKYISDYDMEIAKKLAKIVTGGDIGYNTPVSEQHILDLEREAFISLCGNKKTQDRMNHMMLKGKPLRN